MEKSVYDLSSVLWDVVCEKAKGREPVDEAMLSEQRLSPCCCYSLNDEDWWPWDTWGTCVDECEKLGR
jgi:hypothetical protein